ncbi:hypothetical protein CLF_103243 [Clonorchis sinensis]|uniref:Uncharacterized protein n=1 Tax=Clonorchis sinensis TaxID=79923 RepID=G7Y9D9_CLOSI|nr:hypothetical protein CLF_103243 [Clonorchis sinensis]
MASQQLVNLRQPHAALSPIRGGPPALFDVVYRPGNGCQPAAHGFDTTFDRKSAFKWMIDNTVRAVDNEVQPADIGLQPMNTMCRSDGRNTAERPKFLNQQCSAGQRREIWKDEDSVEVEDSGIGQGYKSARSFNLHKTLDEIVLIEIVMVIEYLSHTGLVILMGTELETDGFCTASEDIFRGITRQNAFRTKPPQGSLKSSSATRYLLYKMAIYVHDILLNLGVLLATFRLSALTFHVNTTQTARRWDVVLNRFVANYFGYNELIQAQIYIKVMRKPDKGKPGNSVCRMSTKKGETGRWRSKGSQKAYG